MKILATFFLLLFLGFFQKTEPITLISAQQQEWIAGRKESGKGIDYTFKFLANRKIKKLQFKTLVLGDKNFELSQNNSLRSSEFRKGDTVILKFSRHWKPNANGQLVESTEKYFVTKPIYDRIVFTIKNKEFAVKIGEIKQLPRQNYQ